MVSLAQTAPRTQPEEVGSFGIMGSGASAPRLGQGKRNMKVRHAKVKKIQVAPAPDSLESILQVHAPLDTLREEEEEDLRTSVCMGCKEDVEEISLSGDELIRVRG